LGKTREKIMRCLVAFAVSCVLVPFAGPLSADGFTGPVFGLATAPNGDLLAADAAAGIVEFRDGEVYLNAALPGATDVDAVGRGSWWAVTGGAVGQEGTDVGQAVYRASRGKVRKLANLFEFEAANNPVPPADEPDSNPFDVYSLDGANALVVDAAGNDLLRVDDEGQVGLVAAFPYEVVSTANLKSLFGCPAGPPDFCNLPDAIPAQPVPTSVAVGPDGYYYVGELKGFPAPTGESRIWRIAPGASWAQCPDADCELVFDGGFTSIIDLAFGPDKLLYVLELDENSWFAANLGPGAMAGGTINACDVENPGCVEVATAMPLPTAITFGKNGALWSTLFGPVPGGMATVVEIP
jgi:hypothetical protein